MKGPLATNPLGANSGISVTDQSTFRDADGNWLLDRYGTEMIELRANAAITQYDLVSLVAATSTVPLSVKQAAVADNIGLKFGIALDAATAAGQVIRVAIGGFAPVRLEAAQTPALGSYLIPGATTAGRVEVSAAPGATTVVDTLLGIALGAKVTINSVDHVAAWLTRRR